MRMIQSSRDVYSLTGTYFSRRALRRAKATPIPADAKNMTQNRHIVYSTASPEPMVAIAGDAISMTALKSDTQSLLLTYFGMKGKAL